jgi:hypothetical protein
MDLHWLLDRREFWTLALTVVAIATLAPFFPRWNAWFRKSAQRLFGSSAGQSGESASQEPMEVVRFVERHEPDLLAELARSAAPGSAGHAAADYRYLVFWVKQGLPLLGKYGSRASDDSVVDLFRYFYSIALRLHERGDGSSYHYLATNPLDIRIGSQVDAAFYPTADRLLASLLFSAIGRSPQRPADGQMLFASVVQRATAADRQGSAPADDTRDTASSLQTSATQYLAILNETLQSGSSDAATILRHLLIITHVSPGTSSAGRSAT